MWAHLHWALVLSFLIVVGALAVFLSELSSRPLGWLWAAAALGFGAAAVGWLLWSGEEGRGAAVAVATTFAVILGVAIGVVSPPGRVVLGRALDELEVPEDAELVEESSGGNALCFDLCTTVERRYVVAGAERREVLDDVRAALRAAGYELQDDTEEFAFATRSNGRPARISGRVDPRPEAPGVVLDLTARVD